MNVTDDAIVRLLGLGDAPDALGRVRGHAEEFAGLQDFSAKARAIEWLWRSPLESCQPEITAAWSDQLGRVTAFPLKWRNPPNSFLISM